MSNLNLGLIGNGAISALIDERGHIVWSCFPRFDGDPVFCHLLQPQAHETGRGAFGIELVNFSLYWLHVCMMRRVVVWK